MADTTGFFVQVVMWDDSDKNIGPRPTLINRTQPNVESKECFITIAHMTTCTKNPIGNNALWDGPDIFSLLIPLIGYKVFA